MKVVQELVAYFERKGRLSKGRLRKLLDRGFLAADAPPTMLDLCDTVGATYYFRVRGEAEGSLWGTDVYTGDSALSVAAVHAGLVKPGVSAVVKVKVVPPPTRYQGCVRNGVASHDFGRFGSAYRLSIV
ncbi:MAG: LCCL domain-containing protein [Xanthobacteraceae bacterium]